MQYTYALYRTATIVFLILLGCMPTAVQAVAPNIHDVLSIIENYQKPVSYEMSAEMQSEMLTASLKAYGTSNGANTQSRLQGDGSVEIKIWTEKEGAGKLTAHIRFLDQTLYLYVDEISGSVDREFGNLLQPFLRTWIRFPVEETKQAVIKRPKNAQGGVMIDFTRFFTVKTTMFEDGSAHYLAGIPTSKKRQIMALLKRQLRTLSPEARAFLKNMPSVAIETSLSLHTTDKKAFHSADTYLDVITSIQGKSIELQTKQSFKALASYTPVRAPDLSTSFKDLATQPRSSQKTATPKQDVPKSQLPFRDWSGFKSDEWYFKQLTPIVPKNTRDWDTLIPQGILELGDRFTGKQTGGGGFETIAHRYRFENSTPPAKTVFRQIIDGYAAYAPGVTIQREYYWKDNGWDGVDFSMYAQQDDPRTYLHGSIIWNGHRLYLIIAQSGNPDADEKYLESFEMLQ